MRLCTWQRLPGDRGGPLSQGGAALRSKQNKTKKTQNPGGFFPPPDAVVQELPTITLVAVRGGFTFLVARHAPWGDRVVSLHLPSPALLLSGEAWGGTSMAWVPSEQPGEPPKYLLPGT